MTDTAAKVPGKVITATKATKAIVARLTKKGVSPQAITELERAGVVFSKRLVNALAKSNDAINFVNRFHACLGFTELVKDRAVSAGKQEGALFAMAYAVKKVNPALAKFELGAGITKRVRSTEVAARRVDISAGGINHELKSWSKWTLERALRKPSQLVKDTAIFGRAGTKWVFKLGEDLEEGSRRAIQEGGAARPVSQGKVAAGRCSGWRARRYRRIVSTGHLTSSGIADKETATTDWVRTREITPLDVDCEDGAAGEDL